MVVRTRSSLGRFQQNNNNTDTPQHNTHQDIIPENQKWIAKAILIIGFIFLFSPWMFMVSKSNSLFNMIRRLVEFYDDNFSCKIEIPVCNCTSNITKSDLGF